MTKRKIRLTTDELNTIIESFESFIDTSYELRLFGSRVKTTSSGGDIDLLLISKIPVEKDKLRRINIAIQEKLGVQKIDIVSTTFDSHDSFVELIKGDSIKIWEKK
ncbi:MAG: nucleotidyltransferase domain-containing protein [Candidatus Kapaibacteriales bacterium]